MKRRARSLTALAAWFALFFLLGSVVWSFQGGELMLLAYLAVSMIVYMLYAFLARCPHCRMPVLLVPFRFLGMDLYRWTVLLTEHCRYCGKQLK